MILNHRVRGYALLVATACATTVFGQTRLNTVKESSTRGSDPNRSSVAVIKTAGAASSATVATEYDDYAPGDTALINGSGFHPNEIVTLQVIHLTGKLPGGGEGHEPWWVTTDDAGNFSSSWFVHPDDSGGATFMLTADCEHGLHAEHVFTDTVPGHGVVTGVVADDGGCVASSANSTISTTWDVQPGKSYTITIEGVDDAANGGTDATMPVFLQNSTLGNYCLTAVQTAVGTYQVSWTIPINACITFTINYGVCDAATARRARGNAADANPATSTNGVHLRANSTCTPDGAISCSATGACCDGVDCQIRMISNCLAQGGVFQGVGVPCTATTCNRPCEVGCPADITVDCNGSTDPAETGSATCSDGCASSYTDSVVPGACPQEATITRTWTCTSPDGSTASCDQIIRVVDTTAPVVTCPEDCEVECGEAVCITPLCDTESCACGGEPTCTDDCGECSISGSCIFVPDGCPTVTAGVTPPPKTGTLQKTFSSGDGISTVAGGGCPNVGTCTQTIRIVDTRAPVIIECPADATIDCSETPVFGEPVCEDSCDTCRIELVGDDVVTPGSCPQESSITRCWVAVDQCGNRSEPCCQTINIRDTTPPEITCPEDCQVECGSTDCAQAACDDSDCSCGGDPTCTDDCGECFVSESCEFFPGGCDVVTAGVTPPPKTGTLQKTFFGSDGLSTLAGAGCPNTASCVQNVQIVDTIPPSITCSENLVVQPDPGACCATVSFDTQASDSCDDSLSVSCSVDSGTCVGMGTTTVSCSASDDCSNADDCTFTITVPTSICGTKKYDANGDGVGETGIAGWKIELSGDATATTYTDASGRYCFNGLATGRYVVREVLPSGTWFNTTPTSCTFENLTCPQTCNFNNACMGGGGGLTPGFWSNKNGQQLMNDGGTVEPELALLRSLNLRNATGANFDPTTYRAFQTWLLNGTATNMSYMLSVHLAAMTLNVESGRVAETVTVAAPGCGGFVTVSALMSAANTALGADGYTPSGDPNRALQECLKNALDQANNNLNFVRPSACSFSPY